MYATSAASAGIFTGFAGGSAASVLGVRSSIALLDCSCAGGSGLGAAVLSTGRAWGRSMFFFAATSTGFVDVNILAAPNTEIAAAKIITPFTA